MGRVIYAGGFKLPSGNAAAHRVIALAKGIEKLNYEVRFIENNKVISLDEVKNMNVNKKSLNILTKLKKILGLDVIINSRKQRAEFIILYNYWSLPFFIILVYSCLFNIKVISDCTEWYGTKGLSWSKKVLKWIDTEVRMRFLNRICSKVISISGYLHGFYGANSVLIPPLIDASDRKWKCERIPYGQNKFCFLYSGNVGANKDKLGGLISAIANSRFSENIKLIVAGTSREDFIKANFSNGLLGEHEKIVEFLGKISHEELIRLQYQCNALFFIRPETKANRAGFPTKFVEAYTVGLPIITNDVSDVAKYITSINEGMIIKDLSVEVLETILNNYFEQEKEFRGTFDFNNFDSRIAKIFSKI